MKIVILAGGSGTRLWPISRGSFPKQFLKLGDDQSFLQKTVRRFLGHDILIVTNLEYKHLVKSQIMEIDPRLEEKILIEPESKNTGPAIAFAMKHLNAAPDECILIVSSDHVISPEEKFLATLPLAEEVAKKGFLVTFGARPNKPETGYGYIKIKKTDNLRYFKADSFVEKPDLETAKSYLLSGDYLWNCGIFAFTSETFWKEVSCHCPHIADMTISLDYALMEKSKNIAVIPLDLVWSDMGTWDSVFEIMDKDKNQNVKIGNVYDIDTKNSLIIGGKRLISTIGLENILVVETEDAIFIGKKGDSQRVKGLVEELRKRGKKETSEHLTTHRPWGEYTILEEGPRYKVKRIVVNSQQALSLQKHQHRSEHWIVVKGTAKATVGETEHTLQENESIYVPKETVHRLANPGADPVELIEVQVGEYLGEDDIIRLEDVYGRS